MRSSRGDFDVADDSRLRKLSVHVHIHVFLKISTGFSIAQLLSDIKAEPRVYVATRGFSQNIMQSTEAESATCPSRVKKGCESRMLGTSHTEQGHPHPSCALNLLETLANGASRS